MSRNDRTPTLSLEHSISVLSHKKQTRTLTAARKARQKRRLAGQTTGCWSNKATCIDEKQRVRQPAAKYIQKNKQKKNKYIHTQTQKYACWYVCLYEERERISVTLVTTAAQGCPSDLCTCTRVRAGTISLISLLCLFVYQ
jgi:hypothetical protein